METSTHGSAGFRSERGLPVFGGELFTCSLYNTRMVFDNIRIYSPKGEALLSFSSDSYGIGFSVMKSIGSDLFVISSTYYCSTEPNYYFIQPVAVSGGLMATTGTRVSVKTSPRTTLVYNEPDTIYFFGVFTKVLRISSIDGSIIGQSADEGLECCYPQFIFQVTVFDAVLTYFGTNQTLALFGRTNLDTLRSTIPAEWINYLTIQSRLNETVLWNIYSLDNFNNALQRRVITNDVALWTTEAASSLMPFYKGAIAQLGTFKVVMVSPYHDDAWTPSTSKGLLYFVREETMEITSFLTPQSWMVMRLTPGFSNSAGEDGGRRFYIVFSDERTQNIHSYYFLVDTCMSLDGTTLSCSDCPNGYWRASPTFAIPRRCIAPNKFPTRTGMSNTTMTFETCTIAQCTNCTYDYTRCAGCDTSAGYYLRQTAAGGVCEQKSQFPPLYGVDQSGKFAIPCADPHCTNCNDHFDICLQCDTAQDYFKLNNACVSKIDLQQGQGINSLTGSIQNCTDPDCLDCVDSFSSCKKCNILERSFLNTTSQSCILLDIVPANQGADLKNGTIKDCFDTVCVDCRENYKECVKCKNTDYTIIDDRCLVVDSSTTAPRVRSLSYSIIRSTAEILFDQPIRLKFNGEISRSFRITVEDQISLKNYECKPEAFLHDGIQCLVTVLDRSIKVLVSTELEITKGRIMLVPFLAADPSKSSKILSKFTNEVFTDFPIVIEGFCSDKPRQLMLAATAVAMGNKVKPYVSFLLAGVSLSANVLLDKYMVNLEYLALLEGPLLIYPQEVFDIVIKLTNYLPLHLLPSSDTMMHFRSLSDCQPSNRFAQQEYECSVLGNTGPDTYAVILLGIFCVILTVACNKLIEMRVRAWKVQELRNSEIYDSAMSTIRSRLPRSVVSKPSSVIIHSSSRVSRVQAKKVTQQAITGSESWNFVSETNLSQTPSSDSAIPQDPSKAYQFISSLREVYGMSFFIAKLEANQLKLILVIVLNYWNCNKGSLEQYSLIAAIIFTLYYIFQGYFTYQFAEQIWNAVSRLKLGSSVPKNSLSQTKLTDKSEPSGEKIDTLVRHDSALKSVLPDILRGPYRDLRATLFNEMKTPTNFMHLCLPIMTLLRCFLISCMLVMLSSLPFIQLTVALIVEIAYLVFIIKAVRLVSRVQFVAQIIGQILIGMYLFLKLITITVNITEATRQKKFGYCMVWILIAYALTAIFLIVFEVATFLYSKLKGCRKKKNKVASVHKSKSNFESRAPPDDKINQKDPEQPNKTPRFKTKLLQVIDKKKSNSNMSGLQSASDHRQGKASLSEKSAV